MTPDEFIEMIRNTAGKVCAEYNLPASVCIAQAILESGWGRYCIGQYNYFGRKWNGWGNYERRQTTEYINGEYVTIYDKFQSYESLEEAIRDWCVLITEEPAYADALAEWQKDWSVTDFVYALAPVYATDPDYARKIIATMDANDLYRFDGWGDETNAED